MHLASDNSQPEPMPRVVAIPAALAAELAKAQELEAQTYDALQQTVAFKDYMIAQQQRIRIEVFIAGELGCKPSLSRVITGPDGEPAIECDDTKAKEPNL